MLCIYNLKVYLWQCKIVIPFVRQSLEINIHWISFWFTLIIFDPILFWKLVFFFVYEMYRVNPLDLRAHVDERSFQILRLNLNANACVWLGNAGFDKKSLYLNCFTCSSSSPHYYMMRLIETQSNENQVICYPYTAVCTA